MAKRKTTDYIVIHCAATKPSMDIGAADIDKWHRQQGWSRIGYAFVIRRNGTVEHGRGVDEIGAHVKGFNAVSVGICMAGGIDAEGKPEDNFTDEQWVSLEALVMTLHAKYPRAEVVGHRDFPEVKKACPCFDARTWWKKVHPNS